MGSLTAAATDPPPAPAGWLPSIAVPWLVLLLLVSVVYQLRSWYRLRHIPGPFAASVSQLWMVKHALSGRFHERLRDVSEKYGSLTLAISGPCPSHFLLLPSRLAPLPFLRLAANGEHSGRLLTHAMRRPPCSHRPQRAAVDGPERAPYDVSRSVPVHQGRLLQYGPRRAGRQHRRLGAQ